MFFLSLHCGIHTLIFGIEVLSCLRAASNAPKNGDTLAPSGPIHPKPQKEGKPSINCPTSTFQLSGVYFKSLQPKEPRLQGSLKGPLHPGSNFPVAVAHSFGLLGFLGRLEPKS